MDRVAPVHARVPRPRRARRADAADPWRPAVAAALADPGSPALMFQPIVDLRRGVVAGYEALSRFPGPPQAPPDAWFAAADRLGVGAALEARVVQAAVDALPRLPDDCFLTVNASPHLLVGSELSDVLAAAGSLERLVVELTEHVQVDDPAALAVLVGQLRAAGAAVALDDAGSGYSGLQQLAALRPEFVKIDRAFVDHADRDEVKLALVQVLGTFAGRLDACLIAEGIERHEELEAFVRLGVPLGQGWLLGRPGSGWPGVPPAVAERIRTLAAATRDADRVGALVQSTPVVAEDDLGALGAHFAADPGLDLVVVVDRNRRPAALVRRAVRASDASAEPVVLPVSLRVSASADVAEVAGRAMTRPPHQRFDPLVCADDDGTHLGVVRPERIVQHLAGLKTGRAGDDDQDTPPS